MEPTVTLTQAEMAILFDKWNKDAEANGWDKKPYDATAQAEHFFKEAEALLNGQSEN